MVNGNQDFDPKKFFRPGGGTRIITEPTERREAFREVVERAKRRPSSGVGRPAAPSGTLIEEQVRIQREQEALQKSSIEAQEREAARQERIQAGTIAGQVVAREEPDGFRVRLTERERMLPTRQVIAGRFREVGTGIVAGVGGLVETGVGLVSQLGVQKIEISEEGERIRREPFRFDREGFIGRQIEAPSGTGKVLGQALVLGPLIGAGVAGVARGIAATGVRATAIETVTSVSPFRIPTQTFGPLQAARGARDLRFDVVSARRADGDITRRVAFGRARDAPDVTLISRQISRTTPTGQQIGFARTDITAPTTEFRAGRFIEGFQTVRTESVIGGVPGRPTRVTAIPSRGEFLKFFGGEGGEKLVKELIPVKIRDISAIQPLKAQAGVADVFTRTTAALRVSPRGAEAILTPTAPFERQVVGGITRGLDSGITGFISGPARRGLVITRTGVRRIARVPRVNIRGLELDITRAVPSDAGVSGISTRDIGSGLQQSARQLSAGISRAAAPTGTRAFRALPSDIGIGLPTTTAVDSAVPSVSPADIGSGLQQSARQLSAGISRAASFSATAVTPPSLDTGVTLIPGVRQIARPTLGIGVDFIPGVRQRIQPRPDVAAELRGVGKLVVPGIEPSFQRPREGQIFETAQPQRARVSQRLRQPQAFAQLPRAEQFFETAQPQRLRQPQLERQLPIFGIPQALISEPVAPPVFGIAGIGAVTPFRLGPPPRFPFEIDFGRRPTRPRRRRPGRIAPSLTGITVAQLGDIFGTLPSPGRAGILPTQIRFQPAPIDF